MKKLINNEGKIINDEYTLKTWVNIYRKGYFNNFSTTTLIDMGAYDWWGSDKGFYNTIMKDFAPKIVALSKSNKINPDKTYVFFKQCCPLVGPRYCDFRICDIKTGDVLFCICHLKNGCYGEDFQGWEVWDFSIPNEGNNKTIKAVLRGTWNDVKKYFNI